MDKGALKIKRVVKRRLWSGANPNMVVDSFWVPRGHAQITQGFSNTSLVFWNASKKCGGKLSRAIESRSVTGVRAGHGQGAGRATAVEADGEGCPDALERYVRVACVSLCRSVSSHENARVPHTAVPWQALGSLQPVLHESILSIPSLRDSWAVTVALDSE